MRTAEDTIYNFHGKKEKIIEDVKKSIDDFEKMGLEVDTIKIEFGEIKFQSDPKEGNLPIEKQNKLI
jgi:hypothetical protein